MTYNRSNYFLTQTLASVALLGLGALAVVAAQSPEGAGGSGATQPVPARPLSTVTGHVGPDARLGANAGLTGSVGGMAPTSEHDGRPPRTEDEQLLQYLGAVSLPVDETETETYYNTRFGVLSRSQLAAMSDTEQAALLGTDPRAFPPDPVSVGETLPAP